MVAGDTPAQNKIDKKMFEKLCSYQCTEEEIAGIFEIDIDTLVTWCKNNYNGDTFSDVYKKYSQTGKLSLRRAMFKNAIDNNNATVQIWLSKQHLGMKDIIVNENKDISKVDELLKEIKNEANK